MGFDARGARKQKSYKRIVNQLKNKKDNLKEELVKIPLLLRKKLEINFSPENNSFLQNISICLQNIEKSYQGKFLFKNLSLKINANERLVIKGANGAGK